MGNTKNITSLSNLKNQFYLGIDLGGTNTKIGVLNGEGEVLIQGSVRTYISRGPQQACRRIADEINKILDKIGIRKTDITAAGLASAGTMDIPGRMLIKPANLGEKWYYTPICDMVSQACGIPVIFSNDASAAAYGEYWVGKGAHARKRKMTSNGPVVTEEPINSMILLTLGTGVGCGIIINKCVYDGEHSHGGEYGHSIIDTRSNARICGCGKRGHLEAYASATSVIARAREAVSAGKKTTLSLRMDELEKHGAKIVGMEASAGDKVAIKIIKDTAKYLAVGITTLMHMIDPDAFFIGGAMTFGADESPLGRSFLQMVKEEVASRAYEVCSQSTLIEYAELGGDAGFIGAAGIAMHDSIKSY